MSESDTAVPTVPRSVLTRIEDLRKAFFAYAEQFDLVRESREELAPKFQRAYEAYAEATEGSFVSFVRLFDPKLPMERGVNGDPKKAGYIYANSFKAAAYLIRLANDTTGRRKKQIRVTKPLVVMLVETIINLGHFSEDRVWDMVAKHEGWQSRQVGSWRKYATKLVDEKKVEPLALKLAAPRLRKAS